MNQEWTSATTMGTAGVSGASGLRRSNLDEEVGESTGIAAYCEHRLSAPFTVEGALKRVGFETWLQTCLLPDLRPGQVVILDNATFDHGGRIAELVASVGCRLLYLPAYSPDLNRIEKCWAWLKSRIRKGLCRSASLRQAMESVLKDAVS